jgi:RNA polymerase sigma-32 factor
MMQSNKDALQYYARAVKAHPVLKAEEEVELSRRWLDQRDRAAADRLVLCNMRAVIKIAGEFSSQHVPLSDLIQEGTIGLMRAVERYDPERGTRFLSYAAWWIRAYIRDYMLRTRSLVRLGTTQRQRTVYSRLGKARSAADREGLRGEARMERIVDLIGVDRATVESMMGRLAGYDMSLDAPLGTAEDAAPRGHFIPSNDPTPEDAVGDGLMAQLENSELKQALESLPDRERYIVEVRHLSLVPQTLQDVGVTLGISRERVRQLEVRALSRMRHWLEDSGKLSKVA